MQGIYRNSGRISLALYLFDLYLVWRLCQNGMARVPAILLICGAIGFAASFTCWLLHRKRAGKVSKAISDVTVRPQTHGSHRRSVTKASKTMLCVELVIAIIGTIGFGSGIVYSAIPYNGALSWRINELLQKREVRLRHTDFFESGAQGVVEDLDAKLNLPEKLYITDEFKMTFDEKGTIATISTFLYGKDQQGNTDTYLVDYDAGKSKDMTVRVGGEANPDYKDDHQLEPLMQILQQADCKRQVTSWSQDEQSDIFEILYYGRRSFASEEGLKYVAGDADGDGVESGKNEFDKLRDGGEISGFEMSLHVPARKELTPVRYMIDPKYISQDTLGDQQEKQQTEDAKTAQSWTVGEDGTMHFFLDDQRGWRLSITDAAAGSRLYSMERTQDGGKTWLSVNEDPFSRDAGVAEGLLFFDDNVGIAGLTGPSQTASRLFRTTDGGATFSLIQLPMDTVTSLPNLAQKLHFTAADYDYLAMPEKAGDTLTLKVTTEYADEAGILFTSQDAGATWKFSGISETNG